MRLVGWLALSLVACGGGDGDGGGPPTLGTTPGKWEYVPVEGTRCLDNSPTGIAVNLGTSGDLLIYMEGGGACFNTETCKHVAHPTGWNENGFGSNIGPY